MSSYNLDSAKRVYTVKTQGEIERKLKSIKSEIDSITFTGKRADGARHTRLIRLYGQELALLWVLGKGVI